MDTANLKRASCIVPGIGTPVSIYYFITSEEVRSAAKKGLLLLPLSAVIISLSISIPIPGGLLILAGAYLYWGLIASAIGWGFVAMLLIYRAFTGDIVVPKFRWKQVTASEVQSKNVVAASNESFAEVLLKEMKRLPKERRETIIRKMSEVHE